MIVTDTLFSKLLKSFVAFCAIATLGIAASTPAFADQTSKSLDVNLTLGNSISVRILDSTATSDLSLLSFDLTPTAAGVTSTKRAVVDVSTSNITGYKLYVEANGKDHNNQYTTDLVQGDTADSHVIPTSTSTASNKNFWNYVNPATSTATVVPSHGNPDQIGYLLEPTTSTKANVDINVGVDTTITAGSYTNQLLFTAIANAESINYTLAFDRNAPSGVDPSTIENFPVSQTATSASSSYTFTIPSAAPSLVGYTFEGYLDPAAAPGEKGSTENPYLPGDNVTIIADPSGSSSSLSGTLTLSAEWTIIRPTLTVDPDGGTWSGSSSAQTFEQDYGTTKHIDLPSANATYTISYNDNSQGATFTPTPTSVERSFTEWQLAATRSAGPGSWDPATSTYTFGTTNGTLTAVYNSTSNTFTLPVVTKEGHTCKWHAGSASGTEYDSGATGVTVTADTEFFVVCGVNPYTLTVNPNGGTWSGSTSSQEFAQNYGTTKTIANPTAGATCTISYNDNSQGATFTPTPASVERPFTSWSLTATPSGTAHGSFNAGTYTYGAGNDTLTANYNTTSNSFTLPQISKTGHSCKWAEGSASGTQYDGGTSRTITSNTTYYAVCTINQYTLTIKPNGGKWNSTTSDSTFTQNYNTRYPASGSLSNATEGPSYTIDYNMGSTGITKPTSPTSVHRAFDSWTKSGTGTWDATNKYWTFGAGDGALTASWSDTSEGFTLPALSKTGNTCKWHPGSTSGTPAYDGGATNVTITGNTVFYATCSVNQHTVTVNAGTGIASTSGGGSKSYGSNVAISATLSAGYHFANPKWTVNSGGVTISNDSFTMPDNDVSITANGAINTCPVKYNSNPPTGESATGSMSNSTLTYNSALTLRTNAFAVTGYDFAGWATTSGGSVVYTTSIPQNDSKTLCATHNTTVNLYAKWTAKTYTVTVNKDSNTDSVSGGGTKAYKSTVTLSATPKTGYHFGSWTVNSGGVTISNNQFTMPNNAVTVTANSAINTCTIHYNLNNPSGSTGSGSTTNSSFNYNTSTATTANGFSVTGYQWSGWAETTTGAAVVTTSGGNITATQAASWCGTHGTTKQLYAKWTKKYTYTLNLNTNDGTTNKQILNYPTSGGTTATSHTFTNLNSYAPTRAGYIFKGWATTSTGTSYVTSYTLQSSSAGSTPTSAGFPVTGNLYAIWEINCANGANRICFIANAPSGTVSGTMDDQKEVYLTSNSTSVDHTALSSSTAELTLYSPNWTLSGYGFRGWSTTPEGTADTMYGPNQTITLTSDQKAALGAGGIRLYAQWVASAGNNMANWSGCSSLTQGSVTALTYGSDTYAVAKLADGKCWMIENLRTSTDAGTPTTSMSTSSYTSREYNLTNVSGSDRSPTDSGSRAFQWKSYGGYYSWASAIKTTEAGSTQYSNWNGSSFSTATTATTQGICPSGWRLPRSYAGSATDNAESDFRYLNYKLNGSYKSVYTAAASNKWRTYPNNFVFAGSWSDTSSYSRGAKGIYWSSTVYDSSTAYYLDFISTYVDPAGDKYKNDGYSVRCLIGP